MYIRSLVIGHLLSLLILLSGCSVLPSTEDRRESKSRFTSVENIDAAFKQVKVHTKEAEGTTEGILRKVFGSMKAEEVGPLRIAATLTQNTGDGAWQMLPSNIQQCIQRENAAETCKLLVFSESWNFKKGVGFPPMYILGLKKTYLSSSWKCDASFVLERDPALPDHHEYEAFRAIYKFLECAEDPNRTNTRRLTIFDDMGGDFLKNFQ